MPVPQSIRVPSYRHHKASGQAVVTLSGRDVYLGPYGSPESKQLYERRVAEWLANGRQASAPGSPASITVNELVLAYARHAKVYYDRSTYEGTIKPGLRRLVRLYGTAYVTDFGPLALKAVREQMLGEVRTNTLTAGIVPCLLHCPPDLNHDGRLNVNDFIQFQNAFATGDPRADFDGNGLLNVNDFIHFQNQFALGCQ